MGFVYASAKNVYDELFKFGLKLKLLSMYQSSILRCGFLIEAGKTMIWCSVKMAAQKQCPKQSNSQKKRSNAAPEFLKACNWFY